jgi:thymidylate kinase
MKNNNKRIIAVEGFDGTGKSTISNVVANNLGFEYHKSPSGLFSKVRDEFDKNEINYQDRLAFYIGDCVRISMMLQNSNSSFVLDRYYYSTLAYHEAKFHNSTTGLLDLCRCLTQPDLVILIRSPFEVLKKRIIDRNEEFSNDIMFLNECLINEIYSNYKKFINVPLIEVDNNGHLKDVLNNLMSQL